MANESQTIKHNHEHEVLPQLDKTDNPEPSTWGHTHFHSHSYRQSQSQACVFAHNHTHIHADDTPKHALADLTPDEKARIVRLIGRCSWDKHLESLGIRSGADISQVNQQAGGGASLVVNGQTVSLSAAEAASVMVEVQQ